MSLLNVDHGPYENTETRFVSHSVYFNSPEAAQMQTQYIQYFDGKPVARFKVFEPKRKQIRLHKTPLDHLRQMWL